MPPKNSEADVQVVKVEPKELTARTNTVAAFYSGPLPPASEFEKYEKVLKGSADRIIAMAEN